MMATLTKLFAINIVASIFFGVSSSFSTREAEIDSYFFKRSCSAVPMEKQAISEPDINADNNNKTTKMPSASPILKEKGFKWLESYPRMGELSDAHSYHGPVSLYSSEGFFVVNEAENSMIMRRNLTIDI